MRLLVLLLLLANVAFFAWTMLGAGSSSGEAYLVQQQINPERIRVLSPKEAGDMAAGKGLATPPVAAATPTAAPANGAPAASAPSAAPAPATPAVPAAPAAAARMAACME